MADTLYQPKVYKRQGGDVLVVKAGGKIVIQGTGAITASGESKAAHIAALTSSANVSAAQIAKINGIITALQNIGVLATS